MNQLDPYSGQLRFVPHPPAASPTSSSHQRLQHHQMIQHELPFTGAATSGGAHRYDQLQQYQHLTPPPDKQHQLHQHQQLDPQQYEQEQSNRSNEQIQEQYQPQSLSSGYSFAQCSAVSKKMPTRPARPHTKPLNIQGRSQQLSAAQVDAIQSRLASSVSCTRTVKDNIACRVSQKCGPAVVRIDTERSVKYSVGGDLGSLFSHFFDFGGSAAGSGTTKTDGTTQRGGMTKGGKHETHGTRELEQLIRAHGSGFCIDALEGLVLTNAHVVRQADRVYVSSPQGRRSR
jgi:hypothetical protein